MLAWLIVISVFCAILVIAYYHVIKELNDYCTKTDKLLDYDPFIDYNNPYHGKRLKSEDPYDSTPVFIMGIKSMMEEINRQSKIPHVSYRSSLEYSAFENLEHRVDSIADAVDNITNDVCRLDNRLDRHDSDIRNLKERVDCLEFDERSFGLLEERVDNIADSVGGMDNRINELENDLAILTKRVKDAEDVLKEGKVD